MSCLAALFSSCLSSQPALPASTQPAADSLLNHRDLVGLLWNGSNEQKAWAAQRVTLDAGGPDADASSAHRQALLTLDAPHEVLPPLQALLAHAAPRLRAAAAQAICNLALEAAASPSSPEHDTAPSDGSSKDPTSASSTPAWRRLLDALPTLVPALARLIAAPAGAPAPDASAAMPACQALSNFMRGAAFVRPTLRLLGSLPALAQQLAAGGDLKQLFAQMLLNAALHSGSASALDAAEAPQALLHLLLHEGAPPAAHERCLCTLYNMLRGEEGAARRAADIMALPNARQALCAQLVRDQPNCRFLSACLLLCMLRCVGENTNEAEWGSDPIDEEGYDPESSGYDSDEEEQGRLRPRPSQSPGKGIELRATPRRRAKDQRRSEAYKSVVRELAAGGSVLTAVQHALDSALTAGGGRRGGGAGGDGFAYGRREALLQALVAALHALCTMQRDDGDAAAVQPVVQHAAQPQASVAVRRRLPVSSSTTSSGLSGRAAVTSSTATGASSQQQQQSPPSLLDQLGSSTASALLQLLPSGPGAGSIGPSDPALAWASLSLLSLMTTSPVARRVLLSVRHPAALACLSAVVIGTRAMAACAAGKAGGGATPLGGEIGRAAAGTPVLGSAAVTPRQGGGNGGRTARATAAAAMREVAAAYLAPGPVAADLGDLPSDLSLAWGRCQALAAKVLRNLVVAEPAAVLQQGQQQQPFRGAPGVGVVPALLVVLVGPARTASLVASHAGATATGLLGDAAAIAMQQQAPPAPPQQGKADALAPPMPSLSPRPGGKPAGPGGAIAASSVWAGGLDPEWSREVQRHAAAALVSLLVTARAHADAACAAVVEAGGIPVIAEVMKAASALALEPPPAASSHPMAAAPPSPHTPRQLQLQQQQLASWCAALLGRLYVSAVPCQQAIAQALVAPPGRRRVEVLAFLHMLQPGGSGAATATGEPHAAAGPMSKSLYRRAAAGGGGTPRSVAASVASLRSVPRSETRGTAGNGDAGAGTGTLSGAAGGVFDQSAGVEAALAAGLEEAGAVVRLQPVREGGEGGSGGGGASGKAGGAGAVDLAHALGGLDTDVLASTAASRPAQPGATGAAVESSDSVLRTSTQALKDLLSSAPGPAAPPLMRRVGSNQGLGGSGRQPSEELRSSLGVRDLAAALMKGAAAAAGTGGESVRGSLQGRKQGGELAQARGSGVGGEEGEVSSVGTVSGALVASPGGAGPEASGSTGSGFGSGATTAGMGGGRANSGSGPNEAGREDAAASEEAMRQLEQWVRQCQPSFLDDPPLAQAGVTWEEDGTGVALAALEYQ